jgi:hypothetical protein
VVDSYQRTTYLAKSHLNNLNLLALEAKTRFLAMLLTNMPPWGNQVHFKNLALKK